MREKQVMGIYRLYDEKTGRSFIGYSHYLAATKKRLLFELRLNACPCKPLQSFYNETGHGLCYEELEEYHPAEHDDILDVDAHLQAMLLRHRPALDAQLIQGEF